LLLWLLRRGGQREGWAAEVLGAYVAACVLPAAEGPEQHAAEQGLCEAVTRLRQADFALDVLGAAAAQTAAEAALRRSLQQGGRGGPTGELSGVRQLAADALQYFLSPPARLLLGEAHALVAELQHGGGVAAATALPLLCMSLLLPEWAQMIGTLAGGQPERGSRGLRRPPAQPVDAGGARPALCAALADRLLAPQPAPQLLDAHPALLAHACRASFQLTAAYACALDALYESGRAAPERVAAALRPACLLYDDHASSYLRGKLAAKLGLQPYVRVNCNNS
jgi:hypothetical protein